MRARAENGFLNIEFDDGARNEWALPERSDRDAIRRVREDAVAWARSQGASDPGQTNAVLKAFTDAHYFLMK